MNRFLLLFGLSLWAIAYGCSPKTGGTLRPVTGQTDNNSTLTQPNTTTTTVTNTNRVDTVRPPQKIVWCDTIQESQYKQLVVCYEKVGTNPIKADTIKVLNTDPNAIFPPQRNDTPRVIKLKDIYHVAIVMPFLTNRFRGTEESEIDAQSLKSLEFYEGIRIALDSLAKEGVSLHVHVYDSRTGEERIQELLQKEELQTADLIIGPVADDQLRLVANFAQQRQIPLVSPFNPKDNVVDTNRFFIQINPSYQVHCDRIIKFIDLHKAKNPNLLIMGMAQDSSRIAQLQYAYSLYKNDEKARIPQVISGKSGLTSTGSTKNLSGSGLNIVIVPSYREETYIYNVLRDLQSIYEKPENGKENEHIIVVGMPQWKYFENVNIEYYENLNVHLSTEFFVNEQDRENSSFIRNYASVYGMPPREFGYIGFDVMLYFGRLLKKYGSAFPDFFSKEVQTRRHTLFSFEPIYQMRGMIDGRGEVRYQPTILRYENKYVNIIRFNDYFFEKVY